MILKKLKLKNFRGYLDFEIDFEKNMNVFIGRNDVGKSTILEALEIFFNSNKIKLDFDDLCVYSEDSNIEISCCFNVQVNDGKILIDSTHYTNCGDEFLLNDNQELEIKKVWTCPENSVSRSPKIFIRAYYPNKYLKPLVTEKIKDLKEIFRKYENDEDCKNVNKSISAELRLAIYKKELGEFCEKSLIDIDVTKEDAKNVWVSLEKQLPLYFLFEADRKNTDKDTEIQSPLKAVTKQVIDSMEHEIEMLQKQISDKVEEIGKRTLEKLNELNPEIAKNLKPEVSHKQFDSLFNFDLVSDNGIPINKRGSGVRRLILLSYLRAEAEKAISENPDKPIIYAIEEPETSQHPDFQIMIFETLKRIADRNSHQIILTTHTPEIAKMVELKQLHLLVKDGKTIIKINDETEKANKIAKTLGILPFAAKKTVIFVEGPNDVNFFNNLNKNILELNNIIDLEKENIPIIPLGGGKLIDWINKNYYINSNLKEIYIVDGDVEKYKHKLNEMKEENDGRRTGYVMKRREIENYIPVELVENYFHIELSQYKETWNKIDVPKLLCGLVKRDINDCNERESIIKNILNGSISRNITKEMLERDDSLEEFKVLFERIKQTHLDIKK